MYFPAISANQDSDVLPIRFYRLQKLITADH